MTRRKIVLIIVEGMSDETALGILFAKFFDKDMVHVHIMHGDITTRKGVHSQNVISKIGSVIQQFAKSNHYTARDFKQIIHIVDTDGAYIPDNNIYKDLDCQEVLYQTDGIYTTNVQSIVERNQQKRSNLCKLRTCGKVWNVPYIFR